MDNYVNPRLVPKHSTFKYMHLYDELKKSYYALRTEARWEHISSWEVIINRAVTVMMREMKYEVIGFLDETLIENNPLSVLCPLPKFSTTQNFTEYDAEESDPLISVEEKYDRIVRAAVLKEMDRITTSRLQRHDDHKFSRAESIDFLVLIRQYFASQLYFEINCQSYVASKILHAAAQFPELAFEAYSSVLLSGHEQVSCELLWKAIEDKIRGIDPLGYAFHV